jgi:hypothetical protein
MSRVNAGASHGLFAFIWKRTAGIAGAWRAVVFATLLGCPTLQSYGELVSVWEFQNNVNDSQGSFNATPINSPTYAAGVIQQAINLNNVSNQYATVPAMGSYSNATVSAWIRTNDANNPGSQAIFHSTQYTNGTPHFLLEYGRDNTVTGLVIDIRTGEIKLNGGNSPIHENTWYHVAFSYDRSLQNLRLYINGIEVGNTGTSSAVDLNLNNMVIGSGFNRPFNGLIDDLGVWSETLSANKVKGIHSFAMNSTLNYGQFDVARLYGLTVGQSTTTTDNAVWDYATGLTGNPGELQALGGGLFAMNLGGGTGVQMVPEPSSSILILVGLVGIAMRHGLRRQKS